MRDGGVALIIPALDEEAANTMRYQQAYAASAEVISTINSMMQTVINMKYS